MQRVLFLAAAGLAAWMVGATTRSSESGRPFPVIEGRGKVTRFPDAVEQPREGSKIIVDLTSGGPRGERSAGVEKLARFVNIYSSAGKDPAHVSIAVLLHGDATQLALDDASYAAAFRVERNPNLPLMRKLREAGVEFVVCGQSLTLKGFRPEQVANEVELAVSGVTALANRQQDGYAYVPIAK